jgi:hypothetical protein
LFPLVHLEVEALSIRRLGPQGVTLLCLLLHEGFRLFVCHGLKILLLVALSVKADIVAHVVGELLHFLLVSVLVLTKYIEISLSALLGSPGMLLLNAGVVELLLTKAILLRLLDRFLCLELILVF